jgi:hypothetical protein
MGVRSLCVSMDVSITHLRSMYNALLEVVSGAQRYAHKSRAAAKVASALLALMTLDPFVVEAIALDRVRRKVLDYVSVAMHQRNIGADRFGKKMLSAMCRAANADLFPSHEDDYYYFAHNTQPSASIQPMVAETPQPSIHEEVQIPDNRSEAAMSQREMQHGYVMQHRYTDEQSPLIPIEQSRCSSDAVTSVTNATEYDAFDSNDPMYTTHSVADYFLDGDDAMNDPEAAREALCFTPVNNGNDNTTQFHQQPAFYNNGIGGNQANNAEPRHRPQLVFNENVSNKNLYHPMEFEKIRALFEPQQHQQRYGSDLARCEAEAVINEASPREPQTDVIAPTILPRQESPFSDASNEHSRTASPMLLRPLTFMTEYGRNRDNA